MVIFHRAAHAPVTRQRRHAAGSLVPSDRKVRSLLINTKMFWMITFLLWWNTSIRMRAVSVTGRFDGYKNVWYAITKFPSGWTPVGDFGPTCHPAFSSTNIKTQKTTEYLVDQWCSIPPVELQRFVESMPRHADADLAALVHPESH